MSALSATIGVARNAGFRVGLTLEVDAGETAVLLGPNGAGKSTVIAALAGVVAVDEGRVTLAGTVVDDPAAAVFVPPEDRRIGVAFQDPLLFPHLSVLDNVAFGPRRRGARRPAARARAAEVLHAAGALELASRRPHELSGGQARRVALARALAPDPDLLLLDEPFAALDAASRSELRRLLRDLLGQLGPTCVLVSHDPADAALLADRVHVVEGGAIVQSGSPEDLHTSPRTPFVAELTGVNVLVGSALGGTFTTAGGVSLQVAQRLPDGRAVATIAPRAVALHRDEPSGSPRNSWPATVASVDPLGDRTRIHLTGPIDLVAEVTPAAVRALELAPGAEVWLAVKATEIDVSTG